ncbi:M24 family metallopeptidase [Segnochrobactrum spirostomi]|uniref:M24 family metallopeptidase n=1 Tax=Segnochrobactrum spirostomi TaxID=2608987 RepID=A0A6A7Y7Q9_9HYPH|nr:M24 family metallopeptidase [Segnochrobactrum spirostomi]MQT14876.1 M24 family metallopeptidase [Segnochrobactrum spirostomi]
MSFLDRGRAESLLQEIGAEALALFQPENFSYATGAAAGMASMWRRGGSTIALVPADRGAPPVAIVGDLHGDMIRAVRPDLDLRTHPLWIDAVDVRAMERQSLGAAEIVQRGYEIAGLGAPRPTTFDTEAAFALLGEALRERGLVHGRVAADLDFLPAADFHRLATALPDYDWVDGSAVVKRLRAIKTPTEIGHLRKAAYLAEQGFKATLAAVSSGARRADLSAAWRAGIAEAVAIDGAPVTGAWDYISVGSDPWSLEGSVATGAVLKIDAGVLVAGYSSDTARSYSFGAPDPLATEIYAILREGFEAGLAAIRPGAALRDIYAATATSIHTAGLASYQRGHFGHGLGASIGSEEWPFIAADSDVIAEPGMMLAFETPFYGKGIGALIIEDQLLVTDDGIEVVTTLPRDFLDIS